MRLAEEGGRFAYGLGGPFLLSLLPYLLAIALMTALLLRMAFRLREAAPPMTPGGGSEAGAGVAEFIIAFPLLLALMLTILQIALLVQAKFVVNYAAFCAVRSAIVTIPARIRSERQLEERNVIDTRDPDSPKMKIIRRAAALPCVAISPAWRPALIVSTGTAYDPLAIAPLARLTVFVPSLDYEKQVMSRAVYAYDARNTFVEVSTQGGDHDPVTVRVTHRYYLTVPFASRILGRSYFPDWFRFGAGRYYPITEQYTLLNEGEPLYPESQRRRFGDADIETERY